MQNLLSKKEINQFQKDGAVFWQVPMEKTLIYDYKHIQFIARHYFIEHTTH